MGALLVLIFFQAFAQTAPQNTPPPPLVRYRVPDPDPENNMIIEFATAIEGTDGTPAGIGQKATRQPSSHSPSKSRKNTAELPVMGF